jgi:hypothetical protein
VSRSASSCSKPKKSCTTRLSRRPGRPTGPAGSWPFKGVLLEGIEVVLIVSALAARPSGAAPALVGAGVAAIAVLVAGAWLPRPLTRLPETELKWGVGVLLSAFGVFFAAEGLGVQWPGGDVAILYMAVTLGAVSRGDRPADLRQPHRTPLARYIN